MPLWVKPALLTVAVFNFSHNWKNFQANKMTIAPQTQIANAQDMDAQLKATFPDCKFSVTATGVRPVNDRITVVLVSAPVSPLVEPSTYPTDLNYWAIQQGKTSDGSVQKLTLDGLTFMRQVVEIALSHRKKEGNNPANNDFIFHLQIGEWNKPFVVV